MLEDHEARISALGADRAVLAAVNALGDFRQKTRARFRSVDEQLAEIKDLILSRQQ
ncbi:hypothetical protein MDUV_16160 [Mycolicibacterium duvalii]|uniref:Uncharacterized protein n=2 Tax=Mycolicibacterium duvalii TaxID=39688 RepID=A0A7I7JXY0_9MYCO|nr:hypothetical protein MDUV_16160 [Mycolicibacterium duvalii]